MEALQDVLSRPKRRNLQKRFVAKPPGGANFLQGWEVGTEAEGGRSGGNVTSRWMSPRGQEVVLLTGGGRRPALLWTARRALESRATTEQTAGLELQTAAWRRQAVQPFPEKAGAGVSNQQPSGDSRWSSVLEQEERLLQLKSQKTERMISWGIPRERFSRSAADVYDGLDVGRNPESLLGWEVRRFPRR